MLKIQEIHELIKLIDESSVDEFSYENSGTKVSIKKNKGEVITAQAASVPQVQPQQVTETKLATETEPKNEAAPVNASQEDTTSQVSYDHEIVSPMVGTFYSSPSPDQDVYVKKGDKVNADTVVCIVEAMKLFNEIEAEVSGEIVEILAENGELVEYGQPLFRVKAQ